jgi:hypothetical protein
MTVGCGDEENARPLAAESRRDQNPTKTVFCRNLVKPPKPSFFLQAADSDGNINFKIWRVYPLQFASLEIEAKITGATGNPARAFFIGVPNEKRFPEATPAQVT